MKRLPRTALSALALIFSVGVASTWGQTSGSIPRINVTAPSAATGPLSGRLLVFMKQGSGDKEVDLDVFEPTGTWIAAQEVHDLAPGATVVIDTETMAYPLGFHAAPAGKWEAQAVLDVEHSYNYKGRNPENWMSAVAPVVAGQSTTLVLASHPALNQRQAAKHALQAEEGVAERIDFESPALSRFWGKPTFVKAWIILPPDYKKHATERYPTIYWTHGFTGDLNDALVAGLDYRKRMEAGTVPPMICVMLDESIPQGTHEFADSVNDGPWGTALTTEFIPSIERTYRMDARPTGRLLTGHSSAGWATLQLQINYPQIFGGTWSTSPDPSDFHDNVGTNLYAPSANVYRRADGSATPLVRMDGKVVATYEQFAKIEQVLGPYGGQLASIDWVFSPKGEDGAPEPMFDRQTGVVDPKVVQYWHDHYDLANIVEKEWPQRGPLLTGRIHLIVGTMDTFYLDGAAHLLDARLQKLGAQAHFTYLPGRTHMDLYQVGADKRGLTTQITTEMYAVARPGVSWHPATP